MAAVIWVRDEFALRGTVAIDAQAHGAAVKRVLLPQACHHTAAVPAGRAARELSSDRGSPSERRSNFTRLLRQPLTNRTRHSTASSVSVHIDLCGCLSAGQSLPESSPGRRCPPAQRRASSNDDQTACKKWKTYPAHLSLEAGSHRTLLDACRLDRGQGAVMAPLHSIRRASHRASRGCFRPAFST